MKPQRLTMQRTMPLRPGCNPRVPQAGSLSLGGHPLYVLKCSESLGCDLFEQSSEIPFTRNDPDDLQRLGAGEVRDHVTMNAPEL
jgi:hypothetical protein